MKKIRIADMTLCKSSAYSFKEKIELAKQLEKLNVDTIEISEITNVKADTLFVKTLSSFVKNAVISVAAGGTAESVKNAAAALSSANKPRIRVELPVSPVGMEYNCHKKPPKMLEWINKVVTIAKENCPDVEFCALDATRAEREFIRSAIETAVNAGAGIVTLCDSTGGMMPDEFAEFVGEFAEGVKAEIGVCCDNKNGFANSQAALSVRKGVTYVKTEVGNGGVSLESFAAMIKNCGDNYGFCSDICYTQLNRIIKQIGWISDNAKNEKSVVTVSGEAEEMILSSEDDQSSVNRAVAKLGYDLTDEDKANVYEEFRRVAEKKNVSSKDLDAIVANVSLQVPATYKLVSYVVNNGNIIPATAQLTLKKDDQQMQGISIGDGPIDAAFMAVDQIIGHRFELDDFQIQSVTEGREAMGSALVKLRANGKLYSGNGVSTDIIGASILAYINAVNKIVYEEA